MSVEIRRLVYMAFELILLAAIILFTLMLIYLGRQETNTFEEKQVFRPNLAPVVELTKKAVGYYEMCDIVDFYSGVCDVVVQYDDIVNPLKKYTITFTNLGEDYSTVRYLHTSSDMDGNAYYDAVSGVRMIVKSTKGPNYLEFRHTGGSFCAYCLSKGIANCTDEGRYIGDYVEYTRLSGVLRRVVVEGGKIVRTDDIVTQDEVQVVNGVHWTSLNPGYVLMADDMGIKPMELQGLAGVAGNDMSGYEFMSGLFMWAEHNRFVCTTEMDMDGNITRVTLRQINTATN